MTPTQYQAAIDRLLISQRKAGAFLGVDERQSRRWAAGDAKIPESVAKLLRLMIRLKLTCDDETGDPVMVCKHCEATRPMRDDDLEM